MLQFCDWYLHMHGQAQYCSLQLLRFGCQILCGQTCSLCQRFGHSASEAACRSCATAGHGCGWSGPPMLRFIPQPYPNSWQYEKVQQQAAAAAAAAAAATGTGSAAPSASAAASAAAAAAAAAAASAVVAKPAEPHYEPYESLFQEPYPCSWQAPSQIIKPWYKEHKTDQPTAAQLADLAARCAPTSAEDVARWFEEKRASNYQKEQEKQRREASAAAAAAEAAAARQANPDIDNSKECAEFLRTLPLQQLGIEGASQLTPAQLCKKDHLVRLLRQAGLSADGYKKDLIKRVVDNKASIWAAVGDTRQRQIHSFFRRQQQAPAAPGAAAAAAAAVAGQLPAPLAAPQLQQVVAQQAHLLAQQSQWAAAQTWQQQHALQQQALQAQLQMAAALAPNSILLPAPVLLPQPMVTPAQLELLQQQMLQSRLLSMGAGMLVMDGWM